MNAENDSSGKSRGEQPTPERPLEEQSDEGMDEIFWYTSAPLVNLPSVSNGPWKVVGKVPTEGELFASMRKRREETYRKLGLCPPSMPQKTRKDDPPSKPT
jgi:hypothetical protein